ncbi:MAG: hypothetical protein WBA44_10050 [Mesorhizobium sp.]
MADDNRLETVVPTDAQKKAQRSRNLAIAIGLAALVVIFYVSAVIKGASLLDRAM